MNSLFGLSHNATLMIWTLLTIVFLIVLISKYKWNPFVTLLISALILGLLTGMQPADDYFDNRRSWRNARNDCDRYRPRYHAGKNDGRIRRCRTNRHHPRGPLRREARPLGDDDRRLYCRYSRIFRGWRHPADSYCVHGCTQTKMSLLHIGIPILAGLSTVHGLVPPHPAPMIAIEAYDADLGMTILYSFLVGIPAAILAGPVFGKFIGKRIRTEPPEELAEQFSSKAERGLPGFGITLFTILLPVILMLIGSAADIIDPESTSFISVFCKFIGHEIIALLIAAVFSFFSLGFARGFNKHDLSRFTSECLAPIATIILIIGAGGAFKQVLINSGVGNAIAEIATGANINVILFAWLVAALIRIATGSATVAMTTAAGIVAPVLAMTPGANVELVVLATGAGSIVLSHVNDAGFWMVKEFFNMTVAQTLKSWTVLETILSLTGLVLALVLNVIV